MSIETYKEMIEAARADAAISETEKEYAAVGVRFSHPLYRENLESIHIFSGFCFWKNYGAEVISLYSSFK